MNRIVTLLVLITLSSLTLAGQSIVGVGTSSIWSDSKSGSTQNSLNKAKGELRKKAKNTCPSGGYTTGNHVTHHTSRKGPFSGKTQYQATVQLYGECNN